MKRKLAYLLFGHELANHHLVGMNSGIETGKRLERQRILEELKAKDLKDFSDDSLRLGYAHAVEVVAQHV